MNTPTKSLEQSYDHSIGPLNRRGPDPVAQSFRNWAARLVRLLAGALLVAAAPASASEDPGLPPGEFVARVYYERISDLGKLAEYDLHEYNNWAEKWVRVSADAGIFARLRQAGWRVAVDAEATADMQPVSLFTFYGAYRTVNELYADLATTVSNYPALTEVVTYGQSYDTLIGGDYHGGSFLKGYDLKAIRVTNRQVPGPKPVFFLMADIHAREITTPEVAMRFLDWLVRGYGTDADATWLVDHHETWIVPTVNPDGHWIVEQGGASPYYQRKNARRSGSTYWPPTSATHYGVDCNRNHSFKWNQGGTSSDPMAATYCGAAPASEPEVSALQTLVRTLIPDQRGPLDTDAAPDSTTGILLTLHSYGRLVLWPWGYKTTSAPNVAGLQALGRKFATYNGYTAQQATQLYPASGTTDDWAYGELGIPAFTLEMGTVFMPAYSTVDSDQWPTNRAALIYACKVARTPYATVRGPDALSLSVAITNTSLILRAVINDTANGGAAIQAAECVVDTPWWNAGAAPLAMSPVDGAFNSPVETVQISLPATAFRQGRHLVWVRGRDSGGNWGPPNAVLVDLRLLAPFLTAAAGGDGAVLVSWDSVTNLTYSVLMRTNLTQPWQNTLVRNLPGTGVSMTYTNLDRSQGMFFRLQAVPRN